MAHALHMQQTCSSTTYIIHAHIYIHTHNIFNMYMHITQRIIHIRRHLYFFVIHQLRENLKRSSQP
jgi:hypothetical protein